MYRQLYKYLVISIDKSCGQCYMARTQLFTTGSIKIWAILYGKISATYDWKY